MNFGDQRKNGSVIVDHPMQRANEVADSRMKPSVSRSFADGDKNPTPNGYYGNSKNPITGGHHFGSADAANGTGNGVKGTSLTSSDFDDTASDGTTENDLARRMMELTVEDDDADFFKSIKAEHACSYCGLSDPCAVACCMTCKKWFCNGRGLIQGSHIVHHMVRSKHFEIQLHKDGPLGDTCLECYNCGNKNSLVLGFIPAKSDSLVVLLCRSPCASAANLKDSTWGDANMWKAVIENRQFAKWMLRQPSEQEMIRQRQINASQLLKLEDMWKTNPDATVEDLEQALPEAKLPEIVIRYDDAYHYQRIFLPLIKQEAETDRMLKESQIYENVIVRWDTGLNKRQIAYFVLPRVDCDAKIMPGDELRLSSMDRVWDAVGNVLKVPDNLGEEFSLQLKLGTKNIPLDMTVGFRVECVWKSTSFDRMRNALTTFAIDSTCMSHYIYSTLLGYPMRETNTNRPVALPRRITAPNLPELNASQVSAVRIAIGSQISLIQGPPGTGKTVTSATLVYHLVKATRAKVLVCAPSNIAVDQLTEKIHKTGLKVVRVYSKSREVVESPVQFLSLHLQMLSNAELKKLQLLKGETGELSDKDERRYRSLRVHVEQELLSGADVVCTTCVGGGDPRIGRLKFKVVLIDESTQSIEPECLIPVVMGCKQLVLVGDHCQLGPVVMSKDVAAAGLSSSMFERLIALGLRAHRLQVQYRMHPILSAFSSNIFYEGSLQNGVSPVDRIMTDIDFPWPNVEKPMFFLNICGSEELAGSGTSFLNRAEATIVEKITTQLLKGGANPMQIGIITPYEGQRSFVVQHMAANASLPLKLYQTIEVASVDAFQGREKDIIIMSCVRSNEHQGIGFLKDPRRLNVALTRAKYGLIIVGNAKILAKQPLWNHLLHHFAESGLLVDGPISRMHPSAVELPKLKRLHNPTPVGGRYLESTLLEAHSALMPGVENRRSHLPPHHMAQIDPMSLHDPVHAFYPHAIRRAAAANSMQMPACLLIPNMLTREQYMPWMMVPGARQAERGYSQPMTMSQGMSQGSYNLSQNSGFMGNLSQGSDYSAQMSQGDYM